MCCGHAYTHHVSPPCHDRGEPTFCWRLSPCSYSTLTTQPHSNLPNPRADYCSRGMRYRNTIRRVISVHPAYRPPSSRFGSFATLHILIAPALDRGAGQLSLEGKIKHTRNKATHTHGNSSSNNNRINSSRGRGGKP